jgi:pseudaminic acid synthase
MTDLLQSDKAVIIAELSCNHLQNFDLAVKTIQAMKEAGADYVKVQNDNPDGGITIDCDNKYFLIDGGTLWDGKTLYQLYKETYTPWEWLPKLQQVATDLGMGYFSTPSDFEGVDFLERMNVPAYKVASFEITDIPLVRYIASRQKPVIISTGIATLEDIESAVAVCREEGNNQIALLKCTSSYPAPIEESNLLTLPDMAKRFGVVVGVSDHSMGSIVPATAVTLGARIVEKHFILERSLGGPDAAFSMEPHEFKKMVETIRNTEKALGVVKYDLSEKAKANRAFSRSLFVVEDMKAGEILTVGNLRSIRPAGGLSPVEIDNLLGKKVNCDIKRGTPMKWKYID